MIDWPAFGIMVRRKRKLDRKGIRELARELGVAPSTMVKLDRGNSVGSEIFLLVCTDYLDIDPRKLIVREREQG